jgi:hypothetical protein
MELHVENIRDAWGMENAYLFFSFTKLSLQEFLYGFAFFFCQEGRESDEGEKEDTLLH